MKPTTIDHGELLERKADIARRRLMDTVDELEARKHTAEREAVSVIPIGIGVIAAFFLMSSVGKRLRHWNARRRRRAQWRRLLRAVRLH